MKGRKFRCILPTISKSTQWDFKDFNQNVNILVNTNDYVTIIKNCRNSYLVKLHKKENEYIVTIKEKNFIRNFVYA